MIFCPIQSNFNTFRSIEWIFHFFQLINLQNNQQLNNKQINMKKVQQKIMNIESKEKMQINKPKIHSNHLKSQKLPFKTGIMKSASKEPESFSKLFQGIKSPISPKFKLIGNKSPIINKLPPIMANKPPKPPLASKLPIINTQRQRSIKTEVEIKIVSPKRQPQIIFSQHQQNIFYDDEPIVLEQKKQKVKQMKPYNLQQNLTLELKCRQKLVKLSSKEDQLFPFMVNIKTKELTEEQEQERSPIDLICVIDVSGSMYGEKINLVRKTLINLLEIISPKDRLCLIQFDAQATRLTPLLKNTSINKQTFKYIINNLKDNKGTSIGRGMDLAFKVIKERKMANPITSVFLLTDGLDVRAQKRTQDSLVHYNLINQNFSINCFGFGKDHDEDLLNAISKYKDGNFYFVQKLDTVDQCFAEALGGLMSVVALDVNIYVKNAALKPFEGISIKRTFGYMWNRTGMTSGYKISISQLLAGVEKGYVGEIIIPKSSIIVNGKQRSLCILEVEMTGKNNTRNLDFKKDFKLFIQFINEEEQIGEIDEDGEVMQNYFRVKSAEAIQIAIRLASHQQYEQGIKQLQSVINQISNNKNINKQKLKSTITQLKTSEQYCEPKLWESIGKKHMLAQTVNLMQQRSGIYGSLGNSTQNKVVSLMKQMRSQ